MKEQNQLPSFDWIKQRLLLAQERFSRRLRFLPYDVRDVRKKINYKLLVSPEAHEQAKIDARAFTMDMIDFLWVDTEKKLSILHADKNQRDLIPLLFESSKDSRTFTDAGMQPYTDYRGYPYLVRFFHNTTAPVANNAGEAARLTASIQARLSPQFEIITRWGLTDHVTPTFDFAGSGPISFTTNLTLLAPPKEIETPDEAAFYFGSSQPATSVTEYQVYQDRIVRHHLGPEQYREGARTEQWHFLGNHKSGRIDREYFVYGMYDLLGLMRS